MNTMNTENNANVNPADTDEARGQRNAEAATADNAGAATEADDEGEDDGEQNGAEQLRMADLSKLDIGAFGQIGALVATVTQNAAEHIAAIKKDVDLIEDAADYNKEATEARGDLWKHTMGVVSAVAEATQGNPELRDLTYSYVMGEFLKAEKRTTAKAYASTGRTVLVRLLTQQRMDVEKVNAMSYSDVRAALRTPPTPEAREAAELAGDIRDRITFILRNADKLGGEKALDRLNRIAAVVEKEWNPVKAAKDANSREGKAARELQDLRQQSPRENAQTETVEGTGKPEVYARQDQRAHRTLHRSSAAH